MGRLLTKFQDNRRWAMAKEERRVPSEAIAAEIFMSRNAWICENGDATSGPFACRMGGPEQSEVRRNEFVTTRVRCGGFAGGGCVRGARALRDDVWNFPNPCAPGGGDADFKDAGFGSQNDCELKAPFHLPTAILAENECLVSFAQATMKPALGQRRGRVKRKTDLKS